MFEPMNRIPSGELARVAASAGVRQFVSVSSIGVYVRSRQAGTVEESMRCRPVVPYARSKLAAERDFQATFQVTITELVVVRPPLIYGPRCPGNFARLVKLVRIGLPLPFEKIRGNRHFISVDNLADLVVVACAHAGDSGGTFNVADEDEISLNDVLTAIGEGSGRRVRQLPIPLSWLRRTLSVVGREAVLDKLNESILVDASRARGRFDWTPRVASADGMRAAAASVRREARS